MGATLISNPRTIPVSSFNLRPRMGGSTLRHRYHIGRNFLPSFNLDLATASIPKRDAQGRTVDVHSLRHTFATFLARQPSPRSLCGTVTFG